MSGRSFTTFRQSQARVSSLDVFDTRLLQAEVLQTPVGSGLVRVQALDEPSGKHFLGEATWPRPPGKAKPEAGDHCLVAVDERQRAWVVAWEQQESPSVEQGTTLPSAPYNGQEYDYLADATNGIVWRFRYRSTSASSHKWECVGGSYLHEYTTGGEKVVTANSWQTIPGQPTITLPLAGDYEVRAQATIVESAKVYGTISLGIGHNGVPTEDLAVERTTFANEAGASTNLAVVTVMTGRAASDKLSLYYEVNEAETLKTSKCHLLVKPVRVG